jgi:polyvinyl alcohol dehydrogenase (cytochrome)
MSGSCLCPAVLLCTCLISAQTHPGEAIYKSRCSGCHDTTNPRVPHRDALRDMSSARILRSLDFGAMMNVASPMNREERQAVAAYLGKPGAEAPPAASAFCKGPATRFSLEGSGVWNGWSPATNNTRFQTANAAGIAATDIPHLKLKWAFGHDGDVTAFAPPTVLGNTLFVGSAGGAVYALNTATGCIHWTFQASGPVRAALLAVKHGNGHALLFGDQTGWFYSIDARTGKQKWKRKVEDHESARLTASPVEHDGLVFVAVSSWEETRALSADYTCCTFRGSVSALRMSDGSVKWKAFTIPDQPTERGANSAGKPRFGPSGAGVWAAPTVDSKRKLLYITTGDNFSAPATTTSDSIMALSLTDGHIVWSQQFTKNDIFLSGCSAANKGPNCPEAGNGPDFDFGSSAMLVRAPGGRELIIAGQKSGMVHAIDPDNQGAIVWQSRAGKGGTLGGVQWGTAADNRYVYASVSDVGLVRPPPGPLALSAVMDKTKGGGLTAFRLEDGQKVWFAPPSECPADTPRCSPAQSGALTAIEGAIFSGSLDGHIRAFASSDGTRLWDFDTVRDYQTVNSVKARGGSLDGAGAVIAGGMVYINSGYSRFGGIPGNVLLAFVVENSR